MKNITRNLKVLDCAFSKITILPIQKNYIIIGVASHNGIFWIRILNNNMNVGNNPTQLFLNLEKGINTILNTVISQILKLLYYAHNPSRQYFKLKGLGFFFKYTRNAIKHYIALSLGFSKLVFMRLPTIMTITLNPKKKKFIFMLKNAYAYMISIFIVLLKKIKVPDPYKLKGIKNLSEFFVIKQGKKKK